MPKRLDGNLADPPIMLCVETLELRMEIIRLGVDINNDPDTY